VLAAARSSLLYRDRLIMARREGDEAMNLKPVLFLAIAIGLKTLSHSLELHGDAIPFGPDGATLERTHYHLMALVALLGALGCFIYAGLSAFRGRRG
jgi:hypothetical protein